MSPREDLMAEEDLRSRLARGDEAAYRELVERLEKPLINFLLRFVGGRHAAEDLFQETFVRVIRNLREFRPEASLTTWIFTIARNLALDHLKARRRHREVGLDSAASSEELGRVLYFKDVLRSSTAAGRVEEMEAERRVVEALGALPPAKREALALRVYAGLSYAEIARVVKAPVGTVKFRIHEAVQDLGRTLKSDPASQAAEGS